MCRRRRRKARVLDDAEFSGKINNNNNDNGTTRGSSKFVDKNGVSVENFRRDNTRRDIVFGFPFAPRRVLSTTPTRLRIVECAVPYLAPVSQIIFDVFDNIVCNATTTTRSRAVHGSDTRETAEHYITTVVRISFAPAKVPLLTVD